MVYYKSRAGYERGLRAGLKICPGMKQMAAYLTEQEKAQAERPRGGVSAELMALAEARSAGR